MRLLTSEGTSQVPRTFHSALTPSPEENRSAEERIDYRIFQRPTSSASSNSSEEVTISVEHHSLSHEAEKHLEKNKQNNINLSGPLIFLR